MKAPWTGERGVAAPIVLWLLVLVSILAIGLASTTRRHVRTAANVVAETEARHIVHAAIYLTIENLLADDGARPVDSDAAAATEVEAFGRTVQVRIRDECGKIDLNTAWGDLIGGLFEVHFEKPRALLLKAALLDWRDPDQRARRNGAEDRHYEEAGMPYGARDGIMETVDELQQLLNFPPQAFARLRQVVTVDCLNAGVDPLHASRAVLSSIPSLDNASVDAFLARRTQAGESAGQLVSGLGPAARYVDLSPESAYEITATVPTVADGEVTWTAIVWLTGDADQPFTIREWRRVTRLDSVGEGQ